jgi:hypothetical protein
MSYERVQVAEIELNKPTWSRPMSELDIPPIARRGTAHQGDRAAGWIEARQRDHRLPERATGPMCRSASSAAVLHRVMRNTRLRAANTGVTPGGHCNRWKRIQYCLTSINGAPPLAGVSFMTTEHHQYSRH